jgi:hypothetical protein
VASGGLLKGFFMYTTAQDYHYAVAKRLYQAEFDVSATALNLKTFCDPDCDQKILSIAFVYRVAGDTGTHATYLVGIPTDTDKYFTGATTNSKSVGDVEAKTVLNPTVLLPAGVPLCIQRSSTDAATNTTEVTVQVWAIPYSS